MFEFIKKKRAAKEFQNKYNLSDNEMLCIVFSKVGEKYHGEIKRNARNLQLYKKITELHSFLEEKLIRAKTKFECLSRKYSKENIFDLYEYECGRDLEEFLYLFQYNSSLVRISYNEEATTEQILLIWDKADTYLDAICLYYLLSLNSDQKEYSKVAVFSSIQFLLKKNMIDFGMGYQDIRSTIIERINRLLSPAGSEKYMENNWYNASIVSS